MKIKIALPSDWQEYKSIRLQALKNSPQAFGSSFERESFQTDEWWKERLSDSSRFFVLAMKAAKAIGVAGAINVGDDKWNIIAMYVIPEQRGKGYSESILNFVLQHLKERKAAKAMLKVNIKQKIAIKLYQKVGFQITETSKNEMLGDGQLHDEYVMEKAL